MNTLLSPPLAPLLTRLFAEAEAADAPLRQRLSQSSAEERAALMLRAQTDYRGFYGLAKEMYLPVSAETGKRSTCWSAPPGPKRSSSLALRSACRPCTLQRA